MLIVSVRGAVKELPRAVDLTTHRSPTGTVYRSAQSPQAQPTAAPCLGKCYIVTPKLLDGLHGHPTTRRVSQRAGVLICTMRAHAALLIASGNC
jgi:hypothetical protein